MTDTIKRFHTPEHKAALDAALVAHQDPHRAVAAWFNDVAYEAVTLAQRTQAKNANYVYLYSANLSLNE